MPNLLEGSIFSSNRRIHRQILDSLIGCLYSRHYFGTKDEFDGSDEESFEYWLRRPYPSHEEVEIKVAEDVLKHLQKAIEGFEHLDLDLGRWPRCIEDMANLYFDCTNLQLLKKEFSDFRILPIFLKNPRDKKPDIDPEWEESIRQYYHFDPILSMKNHVREDIPKLIAIAADDPTHPLVHFFEDWAHHRLLYFGNPEVKQWLQQIYSAKFDSLIGRIEHGRPDRPTSKSYRRWQNMLTQSGELGKLDYKYMVRSREVLSLDQSDTPFP